MLGRVGGFNIGGRGLLHELVKQSTFATAPHKNEGTPGNFPTIEGAQCRPQGGPRV